MKKQSFLHGALILTAGIILVKLIGALFKVPLTWIITEDGLGYFKTAYNFYGPIHSLAAAGFPIAISRLVSENGTVRRYRDIRRIYRVSVPIFLITGTAGFLIMAVGAPLYARAIGNPEAIPSLYALAPAVLFSCLISVYRGYYEGLRNMYPTAVSEILEAVGKLVIGLSLAWLIVSAAMREYARFGTVFGAAVQSEEYACSAALPFAAAGAVLGVTAGSVLAWIYMALRHKRRGDGITGEELDGSPEPAPVWSVVARLVKTALPIGAGALAVNVAGLVDSTFLQTRMNDVLESAPETVLGMYEGMIPQVNLETGTVPNFLFGCFSMALTLFMVVPSVTQAFGISALPNVTAAWTKGSREELKHSMETVLRITSLFCIPSGLGMCVLSGPVTALVFGERQSLPVTAHILAVLGIAAIFASLSAPLNSMLQAIGRVDLPVKILAVGLALKVALNYFLVGIPEINVMGAGAGTLACYLFLTIAALLLLRRETGIRLDLDSVFMRPAIASAVCCLAAFLLYSVLNGVLGIRIAALAAVGGAVVVYVAALFGLRAIRRSDLLMLPKGQKLVKVLEKRGWIG